MCGKLLTKIQLETYNSGGATRLRPGTCNVFFMFHLYADDLETYYHSTINNIFNSVGIINFEITVVASGQCERGRYEIIGFPASRPQALVTCLFMNVSPAVPRFVKPAAQTSCCSM